MNNDGQINNDPLTDQDNCGPTGMSIDIVHNKDERQSVCVPSPASPSVSFPEEADAPSDNASNATCFKGNGDNTTPGLPSERTLADDAWSSQQKSTNKRSRMTPSIAQSTPHHISSSKDTTWRKYLYSPQAGMTTAIPKLIKKFEKKGLATPSAISELEKYGTYDLENFTFLQEIIPNLFLGRLVPIAFVDLVYLLLTPLPCQKQGLLEY